MALTWGSTAPEIQPNRNERERYHLDDDGRFLLRLDDQVPGRDLRESVLQKIFGFYSCYFFDGIMKMLLVEPYLHLTPLLGPEDETALTETITEAMTELAERL
ncbi:hypothetical protein HID58_023612 [Brassica napus]|uniref:Uncharacterized protein n=1 Tax=Brassica napus TaxID=3708 RepID=A0ABQ8D2K1_BRANA|nr:hypothetical protein HID58_023612 [Brassica napus]